MGKPTVFICHTPYHVLISLLRAARLGGGCRMLLSRSVPDADALCARLMKAAPGALDGAFAVDEEAVEARNRESRFYRLTHPAPAVLPFSLAGCAVYIYNDWSALGRYLQRERLPYILCEDTVGGTLDPDQHLLDEQRAAPGFAARQRAGRGYLYWGDSRWCVGVESEDAARCRIFPAEKLTTFSKKALLEGLTGEEKAAVRAAFLTEPLPERADGATLLLPRSFVADGLMDQATQDAMFLAVAQKYADGPLFIKTHPRDPTDYRALFPGATVLERTMPSEVLNFCLPFRFRRAVTVQSWVLRGFTAADETVFLPLEEALGMVGEK